MFQMQLNTKLDGWHFQVAKVNGTYIYNHVVFNQMPQIYKHPSYPTHYTTLHYTHLCQIIKVTPIGIIRHTILPNQPYIIGRVMYRFVLALIDHLFDKAKVHGFFNYLRVVKEA